MFRCTIQGALKRGSQAPLRNGVVATPWRSPVNVSHRGLLTGPSTSPITNPAMSEAEEQMEKVEQEREEKARREFEQWYKQRRSEKSDRHDWSGTWFKMFESSATTFASIFILGVVGYSYTVYYKSLVLSKMENAFKPGDPALDLAAKSKKAPGGHEGTLWVEREEQHIIDAIIAGTEAGHYHLIIGEKGTGKSSMLLEAMSKVNGEGCAIFEAHADSEILRVRLGQSLDFKYHEDNIGALFSIRGPRESSALLDIERAFNKLEKVAKARRDAIGKPLILIMNSAHLIRDDPEGQSVLELFQHRAEAWAAANLVTVIFNSDDYWVYDRLKKHASRMKVIPVTDLDKPRAMEAFRRYRMTCYSEEMDDATCSKVYDKVGGRLAFLNRVAESKDPLAECDKIIQAEKMWFLSKYGLLGEEMDDDVMNEQKQAGSANLLAYHLYCMEKDMKTYDPVKGHILPQLPINKARHAMTRADFLATYDDSNVFTIDAHANVRADSVPMMHAIREICSEPGFKDFLDATMDRISDIESLGRTREIELKDLLRGKKYKFTKSVDWENGGQVATTMEVVYPKEEEEDGDDDGKDD